MDERSGWFLLHRLVRALCAGAGAYVSGVSGSNECPAGSARIETEEECRTAVTATGKRMQSAFNFVETYSHQPKGCYYVVAVLTGGNDYFPDDIYAYFNTDAVGAGQEFAKLLCATVTNTGAPPPRRCARACAPACAAVLRVCNIIRVLLGTYMVLEGTPTVLRTPPSTLNSFVSLWQCLWDALGSARRCGAHQSMVRVVRQCRVL